MTEIQPNRLKHQHGQKILQQPVEALQPYKNKACIHSKAQIKQVMASIERFGFTNPVLVSKDKMIIAGYARVEAAKALGLQTVPTLAIEGLSKQEIQAYILADNKLALNAGWDIELLASELQSLLDCEFDLSLTGFSAAELDFTIEAAQAADPNAQDSTHLMSLSCTLRSSPCR